MLDLPGPQISRDLATQKHQSCHWWQAKACWKVFLRSTIQFILSWLKYSRMLYIPARCGSMLSSQWNSFSEYSSHQHIVEYYASHWIYLRFNFDWLDLLEKLTFVETKTVWMSVFSPGGLWRFVVWYAAGHVEGYLSVKIWYLKSGLVL